MESHHTIVGLPDLGTYPNYCPWRAMRTHLLMLWLDLAQPQDFAHATKSHARLLCLQAKLSIGYFHLRPKNTKAEHVQLETLLKQAVASLLRTSVHLDLLANEETPSTSKAIDP